MNNLVKWSAVLSQLQVTSNNTYWISTCQTSNEVLYDFQSSEALNLLQTNISERPTPVIVIASIMTVEAHSTDEECITEQAQLWEAWRRDLLVIMFSYWSSHIDAKDTIAWAAMQVKHYYNINWQAQFFAVRDEVLLRLHCDYKLLGIMNQKLKQQFIELFKVTEQISCLVYHLDLPSNWKIHDVIFIAHLKLTSFNNLYEWSRPTHPSSITVDSADNHYEIERLLWKWVSCWGCSHITEYLVHCEGCRSKHDTWYNVKDLREAKELVREYEKCMTKEQKEALL